MSSSLMTDPRIEHRLSLCGDGSYLSPYWLELSDFLVYDALTATLDETASTFCAAFNARLQRVHRWSRTWRQRLKETAELLEAVTAQLSEQGGDLGGGRASPRPGDEPLALALIHVASADSVRQLVLLVGQGEPSHWRLPVGATLLRADSCEAAELDGFHSPPLLLELPRSVLCGSVPPMPAPALAAASLALLLFTEVLLCLLVLTSLCSLPERLGGCAATVLVFPLGGVLSPFVSTALLAHVGFVLRGASRGHGDALCRASSGFACRLLHVSAVWNAVSMLNALTAFVSFLSVPSLKHEALAMQLWLLPILLLATKLLIAQGIKVLAASVGVSHHVWKFIVALEDQLGCGLRKPGRRRRTTLNILARINAGPRRSMSAAQRADAPAAPVAISPRPPGDARGALGACAAPLSAACPTPFNTPRRARDGAP